MKTQNGFSIVELMVTLAIAGILLAVALPSFTTMIIGNNLSSQSNDLMSDLGLARSEAAKIGARVTLCISSDGASCTAGSDWSSGRIVFIDAPPYGTVDVVDVSHTAADLILKVSKPSRGGNTLVSSFSTGYVQYLGSGITNLSGVSNAFTLCHSGSIGRIVTISVTGRAHGDLTASNCP